MVYNAHGRQATGANTTPLGALNPAFMGQTQRPNEGYYLELIFNLYYWMQWRNDRPCYPCYAGGRHLRGRHITKLTVF